jgi:hypothetical protein
MCYCIKLSHRGSRPFARVGTLLRIITIPEKQVELEKSVLKVKRSWKTCQLAAEGGDITGI